MKIHKLNQDGSHLLAVVLVILVVIVIAAVGWFVFNKTKGSSWEWTFNGQTWDKPSGAPECEQPLQIGSPMDVKLATSKLYPGEVRGTDFKPHGGLGIDDAPDNNVDIYAIRDAYLYQGSRYIENGVEQFMFDFMDPCGIRYRYDHLATLTPEFQAFADQLPPAKPDDSRTSPIDAPNIIKRGTLIATAVGQEGNVNYDLGVYDLRQPNEASKTAIYQTDQKRIEDKEQSFFSVCWFDLLVEPDRGIVATLPSRSGENIGTTGDYCTS